MKSVFISRAQQEHSVFKQYLEQNGLTIIGQSLVSILPSPIESIPITDWIFFYSKNGVHFFFKAVAKQGFLLTKKIRYGAIGSGTAKVLKATGIEPDFVGTGEPQSTAHRFLPLAKGQKVLFPQAAHSIQSIQNELAGEVSVLPLVVYQNEPLKDFAIPPCDLLVFTSPMNAKTYFNRYQLKRGQKILAIGKTTARALESIDVGKVYIATEPSEESLARAALDILNLK